MVITSWRSENLMNVRNKVSFNPAPKWGGVCKTTDFRKLHHAYSDNSAFMCIYIYIHIYIQYIQWCVSQTQQNIIMFIIVLGQHVSNLTESSSDPLRK